MHRTSKPVRKCHGCGLNLRDRCAVYDDPHAQWNKHRRCPGYMNEEMLAAYKAREAAAQEDRKKAKRKATARQRHTEPHYDGDRHVVMNQQR